MSSGVYPPSCGGCARQWSRVCAPIPAPCLREMVPAGVSPGIPLPAVKRRRAQLCHGRSLVASLGTGTPRFFCRSDTPSGWILWCVKINGCLSEVWVVQSTAQLSGGAVGTEPAQLSSHPYPVPSYLSPQLWECKPFGVLTSLLHRCKALTSARCSSEAVCQVKSFKLPLQASRNCSGLAVTVRERRMCSCFSAKHATAGEHVLSQSCFWKAAGLAVFPLRCL